MTRSVMEEVLRIMGCISLILYAVSANTCPNGATPQKACPEGSECSSPYSCQGGQCCPLKFIATGCPNGATPEKACPEGSECSRSYSCQGGQCCPQKFIATGCPNGATPEKACPEGTECSSSYSCQSGQCCPQKFQGTCPDNAQAQGSCTKEGECSDTFQCVQGTCCPRRYQGVPGCKNGGDPLMVDSKARTCSASEPCNVGGYGCVEGICCPMSYNKLIGPCKSGGLVELKDNAPKTCTGATCSVGFTCTDGFCCPQKFNTDVCPKQGIPDFDENGSPRKCSDDKPCSNFLYSCFSGTCCPIAVFTDVCPKQGIPMFNEDGTKTKCNSTTPCPGTTYTCIPSGHCCPTTVLKEYCPNKGIPLVSENGEAKVCGKGQPCNGGSHSCQKGYCCPKRVYAGSCSNGGVPEKTDGKTKTCVEGKEGCSGGYSCREGVCCPARVFADYCPNGAMVLMDETDSPQTCKNNTQCSSVGYSCQGGYCCPQKVFFSGSCPKGGVPKPGTCDADSKCGTPYQCVNKMCCPAPLQNGVCPFDGIPEILDKNYRRCGTQNPCGSPSFTCYQGYCCPQKLNLQDACPGNGIPAVVDDQVKFCKADQDCSALGVGYGCVGDMCCPMKFMGKGTCKNGGRPLLDGEKEKTCSPLKDTCGSPYKCEAHTTPEGVETAHCCPQAVEQSVNITDVCGVGVHPLMTKNNNSALSCDMKSNCPHGFYCMRSNVNGTNVCCPKSVRTKPGECPDIDWTNKSSCASPCRSDSDCPYNKVCCARSCGLQCMDTKPAVKKGFCPMVTSETTNLFKCFSKCKDDAHCTGDQKCCSVGCGNHCMKPLNEIHLDTVCNGKQVLKDEQELVFSAPNMKTLSLQLNSCPVTVTTATEGRLLKLDIVSLNISDCTFVLNIHDGDSKANPKMSSVSCTTTQKGLMYSRGQSVTFDLIKPSMTKQTSYIAVRVKSVTISKSGKCPAVKPGQAGICVEMCSSDNDCDGEEKCCFNGCGHVCNQPQKPDLTACEKKFEDVKSKLQFKTDKCFEVFVPRCDKNGNFSKTQCKDNTGECWCEADGNEIQDTRSRSNPDCSRATKPGLCPPMPSSMMRNIQCVEKCQTDDDCNQGNNSKCCFHGCGTVCLAPRTPDADDKKVCPDDKPQKCCDFHLCSDAACPAYPGAVCRVDPCGECGVRFFDNFNNEVNCTDGLSECELHAFRAKQRATKIPYSDKVNQFLEKIYREGKQDRDSGVKPKPDQKSKELTPAQICSLPAVTGGCKATYHRYYYDSKSKTCEKFMYGGCDGNENNFHSLDQCQKLCVEGNVRCSKPAFVGNCRASIPAWHYDYDQMACEMYYYGGCGADSLQNMFLSKQDCINTCGSKDICKRKNCPSGTECVAKDNLSAECKAADKVPIVGHHIPMCTANGSYSLVQCDEGGHVCWCVDDDGKPRQETISVNKKPNCKSDGDQSKPAVCDNKKKPKVCVDSCHMATCGDRTDVTCRADPCDDCKVHFLDKDNKPVKCDLDMCKVTPPAVKSKPKYGCVNSIEMWYHDSDSKSCKSFKYSPNCHGNDHFFFKSKEECREKCLASICDNKKLTKSCGDTCSGKVCRNQAKTARCVVDKCTCTAAFRDNFNNSLVNCEKLPTTCQKMRVEKQQMNINDVPTPQCRDNGLFSPIQCSAHFCWCIGARGDIRESSKKPVAQRESMQCEEDIVREVILRLRTQGDYDAVIRGKEESFRQVCRQKINSMNKEVGLSLKDCKAEKGSIIIVLTFESNSEVPDPLSASDTINDTITAGEFTIDFNGAKLTVEENDVQIQVMMSSQLGGVTKAPVEEDSSDKTTVIVVVVVVLAVALIVLAVAVVLIKRQSAKNNIQFSSLEENKGTKSNAMYFNNVACEK